MNRNPSMSSTIFARWLLLIFLKFTESGTVKPDDLVAVFTAKYEI